MLKDLFKKTQYATVSTVSFNPNINEEEVKPNIPTGMWSKCDKCGNIVYTEDVIKNYYICNKCDFHFRISSTERINQVCDKDSFNEMFVEMKTSNPLKFKGYEEKTEAYANSSNVSEAVKVGIGKINNKEVALAVMDSNFMMGSMGTVVGEKVTRIIELATEKSLPVIIFTTSGGARMQEGIFSLMQMAKISQALAVHGEKGLLYITVLTDPTTGGVTASFAMQGDVILAEPGALIGFAGRRVIENTIKESLPEDFQSAEFLLDKGFVDAIVNRKQLKHTLYKILALHGVN